MTSTKQVFENAYIKARKLEERVLSDDEVRMLPSVSASSRNADEWKTRAESSRRVLSYFRTSNQLTNILDLGCGNGWFSAQLARLGDTRVHGVDVNEVELEQAQRIFTRENLSFQNAHILQEKIGGLDFDAITINAAVQYFPSFKELVARCQLHLRKGGEIHIWDSPFYEDHGVRNAQERTSDYYSNLGVPEMAGHYFHRKLSELLPFQYDVLYRPSKIKRKLKLAYNPFPWIKITNH